MSEYTSVAMASLLDLCGKLCRSAGVPPEETEGYTLYRGVDTVSWYHRIQLNAFCAHRLSAAERIRQLCGGSATAPLVSIVSEQACPHTDAALYALGFSPVNPQVGMVLSLNSCPILTPASNVIRISRERLEEWSDTCREAFHKADELPAFRLLWGQCSFYGWQEDGKLVATALFNQAGSIGGLHEIGTLEAYRRRGIADRLVRQILSDAKNSGCTAVGLQASAAGRHVYEKLGFRAVCHVQNYRLQQPPRP